MRATVGLLLLGLGGAAQALGLGEAEVRSYIGQPLLVHIPLIAASADEAGCLAVRGVDGDIPGVRNAYANVLSQAGRTLLEVRTSELVNEPALGIRVVVGCATQITRDYIFFLDPAPTVALPERSSSSAVAELPQTRAAALPEVKKAPARRQKAPRTSSLPEHRSDKPALQTAERAVAQKVPVSPAKSAGASAPPGKSDRLVVSHDVPSDELRAAQALHPGEAPPLDPEQARQLRAEQARLIALLTDHEEQTAALEREAALERQVADLSRELASLHTQVNTANQRNKQLEASRVQSYWAWLLGLIALAACVVAAWLGWRFRQLQLRLANAPWWEQTQLTADGGPNSEPPSRESVHAVEVEELPASTMPGAGPPETPAPVTGAGRTSESGYQVPRSDNLRALAPTVKSVPLWPTGDRDLSHERLEMSTSQVIPFGLVSGVSGLEDQVEPVQSPVSLDLDLDLVIPGAGLVPEAQKGVAAGDAAPVIPSATIVAMPRVDPPPAEFSDGTDTRVVGMSHTEDEYIGQASLQFRLIQFATVIDQVDELSATNQTDKAIALLRQYVLRDESIPTLMWLLLFDLYRRANKQPVYEALAEHFQRRYRRPMLPWDKPSSGHVAQQGLNELPELDARIRSGWGTQAGVETMRTLLSDREQADEIVFNAQLQRDVLQLAKVFPLSDSL